MNFPVDHVALEQSGALGGFEHRYPEDNYSPLDLNSADLLFLSRSLSGENGDFILSQWAGELNPLGTTRVRLDNVIRRL
jgi:hypothetical protein